MFPHHARSTDKNPIEDIFPSEENISLFLKGVEI